MKKIIIVLFIICAMLSIVVADEGRAVEEEAIRKAINDAYIDGLCNTGNIDKIKKGFHPAFNLLGVRDNILSPLPIYNWIEYIKLDAKKGKYPAKEPVTAKFLLIDITGNAAMVKLAYLKAGKHIYTDYLALYKFNEGWRLVNKIYYKHPQ